jgi:hypothetical protein
MFGIYEVVTVGSQFFAIVEGKSRHQHGTFVCREDAERCAERLGETFAVEVLE